MNRPLREVNSAIVWKGDQPAATLIRSNGEVQFVYEPNYAGRPVARTLPLGETVRTYGGAIPPFFAGLLPEGRRLNAVQRAAKTSADDDLTLLLMVGSDLIGDVSVTPDGVAPAPVPPALAANDLSRVSFADLLTESGFLDRRGIPGVQDKVSAGMITLPVRFAGAEAIVKLNPPDYPGVVENESYFLSIARRLRLPVVESELVHDREGRAGLVVRRFDRVNESGQIHKLAVEDATQLLGRYPADKYALTSEDAARAVADVSAARVLAARGLLQQFALAWLTGNGDLHGKNLAAVQLSTGEWRVAPIYDVPSTLPYGDHSMALSLQGATQGLTRRRFVAFGQALGLPRPAIDAALDEVLRATEPVAGDLADGVLPLNSNLTKNLIRQLNRRRHDIEAS